MAIAFSSEVDSGSHEENADGMKQGQNRKTLFCRF
jgi:hypothetical protein